VSLPWALVRAPHATRTGWQTDGDRTPEEGACDTELIAAAFCMFNRYVDGLGTWAPTERADDDAMAPMIVEGGYVGSVPAP
jgi:hypothetical protein